MLNFIDKHYNKIIITSTVIILGCIIFLSILLSPVGEAITSTFKEQAINESSTSLNLQAEETLDELEKLELNLDDHIDLDAYIAEQKKLLDQAMTDYYNLQISGLATSADLEKLKYQIEQIRKNIYTTYTVEIDKVIQNKANI